MIRKLSFVLIPLLIVAVLVLALPGASLADEGGPPDVVVVQAGDGEDSDEIDKAIPTDPDSLIDYALALPVGTVVAALLEWTLIKNWSWFRNLKPAHKFFLILGLFLVFPCLKVLWDHIRHGFPESDILTWLDYRNALFTGLVAWAAAIVTHENTKAKATTG